MPELPEVTQEFDADTAPYVAGLEAAIAAAERFKDANIDALASVDLLREAMAADATAAAEAAAATGRAGDAASTAARDYDALAIIQRDVADASADLMMQTQIQAEGFARLDAQIDDVIAHLGALAVAERSSAADTDTSANKSRMAIGRWGISWNALHWIVAGSAELLAVTLPAAIAAGAAALVLYQGAVEQVGFRLQAMFGATEATGAMIGKTTGDVLGLGHAFQTAQDAANPIAYQLLGEYIDAARSHMVGLAGAGLQVDRALGELGARINVDLISQGSQLNALLANMVPDLIEIGQLFGTLGHSVLNLASDMPGLAEVLLKIAVGAADVVAWVSRLSPALITTFMVFEEFSRWGGLVVTILGKLGLATSELGGKLFSVERFSGILSNMFKAIPMLAANAVGGLGSLMQAVSRDESAFNRAGGAVKGFSGDLKEAIASISVTEAALAAIGVGAIVAMIIALQRSKTAAQQYAASLQEVADKAKNTQVMGVLADNMGKLSQRTDEAVQAQNHYSDALGHTAMNGKAATGVMDVLRSNVDTNTAAFKSNQTQLLNTAAGAGYLAQKYHLTYAQAEALADVAGVKLKDGILGSGQAAQIARQQIEGLEAGYKGLDAQGGILGNDMNAVAIQAGLQNTKVQQLNSAWDQFLSNATSLTSSFAGLKTDVGEINNAVTTAGKKFDTFGGQAVSSTQAAAMSLRSFGGVGAQVWQNYDQALQQAGTYTDSLRTAAAYGAVSQKNFTQSVAFSAQQLLPYARYSKTATEELSALAQEAGGPATDNYKTLKDWVDKNTTSTSNFNKIMQQETGQLSDVSQAAQEFASTLQGDLIQAMVTAGLKFSNVNSLMNTYASDIAHGTAQTAAGRGARAQLMRDLEGTGMSAKQAAAMVRLLAGEIQGLHSKKVTLTVAGQITGSGAAALAADGVSTTTILHARPGAQTGASQTAGGVHLVGEMGPELVHLPAGTGVTPSWQTAPLLRGDGGGGGGGAVNLATRNVINVAGSRVQSKVVQQSLVYNRRNPSNNLRLRTR